MQKKQTLILVGLVIVSLLAACTPAQAPASSTKPSRSMNVNGTGEVSLVPDIASINIGVHTEADEVSDALSQNTDQANAIADVLQTLGVEEKDVRTSNFNVYPSNRYDPMTGQVTGTYFVVDNTVTVIVRDLSTLGDVLSAVVNAGANNINGITFDVEDRDAAVAQARELAIQNAKEKAQEIADAAGVELGELLSINVYGGNNYVTYYDAKGGAYAESSVPVSAGTLTITMECSLAYELK
ncbi:SIMPL domain-containing protein [Chloroflexota bacterium]|nr:SIMPL domain-containing protein [Chloroflexota bacterium]